MDASLVRIWLEHPIVTPRRRLLAPFVARYRPALRASAYPQELQLIAREILVTDDRGIALVKNSKAGCTTAAQLLHYLSKGRVCDGNVHHPDVGLIQGPKHLDTALALLSDAKTFRMTTIRHPVDRAVSGFQDFFVDRRNEYAHHHATAIRKFGFEATASAEDNFDAFLALVTASMQLDPLRTDRHFRPQVTNIAHGVVAYDALCRVETLADDLTAAMQQAGVPASRLEGFDLRPRNRARSEPFRPHPGQIERIAEIYAADFDAFGYEPDIR